MDIYILHFLKYGSGLKNLKEIASEVRYVDFFFPNKRILNSDFFTSRRFKSIRKLIDENEILFDKSVLDSIYILRYFGASPKILKALIDNGIRTVKRVARLDSYEFNSITNSKTNSSYNRISKSITQYTKWKSENTDIIAEIIILDYLQHKHENIIIENLFMYTKQYFSKSLLPFSKNNFYETLNEMQGNRLVEIDSSSFAHLHIPPLSEIMSYDFPDGDVFKLYIEGFSFQEIAELRGVTRSRIQQIFVNLLEVLPTLQEDIKYRKLFERYNFSEENFKKIFNETSEVYRFLNYKYDKGSDNVIDYLRDFEYSDEFISQFLNENGYYLNYNNKILKINIQNIFDSFMYENRERKFTYEEARQEMFPYFEKYGLEGYESNELRAFKGKVEYSKNTLSSNDGQFRYYNCEALDNEQIEMLKSCFDLTDGIYGSQKIYDLNKEIMVEFQLQNGDELLDLYNKLELDAPNVNKIVRRSEVQIGKKDKKQFIKEVLMEFNGEDIKNIVWYLSDENGLHKESIHGYILDKFPHLIVNNRVEIARPETDIETITVYLNKKLAKEIYLLREVNNQVSKHFDETISINNLILKNTDYKVHNRHIIKKKYRSAFEAMKYVISKKDIFRIPDSQLTKDNAFYNAKSTLLRNFDIFKVSDNTYINKDKLRQGGIYKEDIFDFIKSVENYQLATNNYFTMKSILKDGFQNKLLDMGFENVFYEEILRNSSKLGVINTTPLVFYHTKKTNKNLADFIYYLVYTNDSTDYQDLITALLNTYGLSYDIYTLREILTETPAYFSHETDKFYKDKEQYYLEVYGK